jgi:hypothetical protein
MIVRRSSKLASWRRRTDLECMPTHRDHPWLKDATVHHGPSDPEDPAASAMRHLAKQLKVIDEARQATSIAPPPRPQADR